MKIKKLFDKNPILYLGLILILGFILYYPSTSFQFLYNFDDDVLLLSGPEAQAFSFESLKQIFTSSKYGLYNPISSLTWYIEYNLFGAKPFFYHLDNILLHLINVVLVFVLISKFLKNKAIGLFSAFLFAIHPMYVENVAWLSSRKDLVYGLFCLLSLISYNRFIDRKSYLSYGLAVLFFIASLLSNTNAIVLPVVFLLFDWYKGRTDYSKMIRSKIPLLILSGIMFYVTINIQGAEGIYKEMESNFNWIDRFFLWTYSIFYYLYNWLTPFNINPKNFYPDKENNLLPFIYYASPFFLVFVGYLIKKSKYKRELIFASLFAFVFLFPVLKLVPTGNNFVANQFAYIPYIGLYAILGYLLINLKKAWLNGIVFLLIIAFGYKTYTYQFTYENSVAVWTKIIEVGAGNNWATAMAYNERGQVYLKYGNQQAALKDISQALKLEPTLLRGLMNRANIYEVSNQLDLALKDLNKALEIVPEQVEALRLRSVIHGKMQHPELAINDLERAIKTSPQRADLYNNKGIANSILGNSEAAKKDFAKAIELDPFYLDPYVNRANLFISLNQVKEAQKDLAVVYQKHPDHFIYAYLIAKTHLMQNNATKAKAFLAPFAKDEIMAGQVAERLAADGYFAESLTYFTIAIGNESIRDKSLYQRANAFKQLGENQNAIDDLMAILENMPNPQFFFEIGNLYQKLNKMNKACEFWKEGSTRKHKEAAAKIVKYCH